MEHIKHLSLGWLVGAAARKAVGGEMMASALVLGMTACSGEKDLAEEPTTQTAVAAQTIHVKVGAGISDGTSATRATVEQTGTTRKLKFSAGDKLWVDGQKEIVKDEVHYWYDIQGQLAIGTIGSDGTTAQFSGDLSVYKSNSSAPDPDLSSLEDFTAVLIPAGSTYIKVQTNPDNGREELIHQPDGIATGELNDLMATNTEVSGTFADASNVTLKARTAFFNCTVTGLEASTAYDVSLEKGDKVSIETDGDGNLHFLAWQFLNGENEGVPYDDIHDLRFYIGTNKRVSLDDRTLYAKVYNMTRAAETYTPFIVTDNTTGNPVEPYYGSYVFKEGNADITVSGESEGESIELFGSSDRVVLSGVTATCGQEFIYGEFGTLNIVLDGANSITNTDPDHGGKAIFSNGPLYLSGNGTLTVTAYGNSSYGIWGSNYQPSDGETPATNTDASVLAADGYTVTRSDMTDNQDGTYSWTYTVRPNPLLAGEFSVNEGGDKVRFSKGNLQATCTTADGNSGTQESWTWQFAEHQWDYVGNATANTAIDGNGSVSTAGTVDLFGWSTAATYYGINNSTNDEDYSGSFVDWGSLAIVNGGNAENSGWRTLTKDEWDYIFKKRDGASSKYGCATVAGKTGLILLPDAYTGTDINTVHNAWTNNEISASAWTAYEAAGAVFLPAAGERNGSYIGSSSGTIGRYWSATRRIETESDALPPFDHTGIDTQYHDPDDRNIGFSVRLVKNVQP